MVNAEFLMRGGPVIWLIAALSVFGLALILWKLWRAPAEGRRAREAVARTAGEARRAAALRGLAEARAGLRGLEVVATVAPLLGLLGTVLGMIAAFQALQESGAAADPSVLAGGIWEALLTTAAGMAVAIPATAALSFFEGRAERLAVDLEEIAAR
ncbi:MAG: MotA/TolQ/ExbB proton channel family protein [Hasllibacter sp.]